MSKGRDGLHLNGVSLVQSMVQNTGRVKYLPTRVFVFCVTDEQILGSEGIGLHINFGVCDVVHETGLTDVGETSYNEGA